MSTKTFPSEHSGHHTNGLGLNRWTRARKNPSLAHQIKPTAVEDQSETANQWFSLKPNRNAMFQTFKIFAVHSGNSITGHGLLHTHHSTITFGQCWEKNMERRLVKKCRTYSCPGKFTTTCKWTLFACYIHMEKNSLHTVNYTQT